jgi:hypothetical protein
MAASAAAIVRINIEKTCPLISFRNTEAETKLIFAANKIISIHISIKIIFLRLRNKPKHPIIKMIKDRIKK